MDDIDIEEPVEEQILDPQVTSADPNERKLARKLRIERRIEALKRRASGDLERDDHDDAEYAEDKSLLQQQLEKSAKVIELLLLESEEYVTNIRVANDSREVDRREAGINTKDSVIDKLEREAAEATEIFDRIAEKWSRIMKNNDPLMINDELILQKEKCDELIVQKIGVINMLKDELAQADKLFSDDQRKQNEDIHVLAKRIEQQVQLVRKAYRDELRFIENVIEIERQMLIENNDKKWDEFYKKRDTEENANIERKFEQLEDFDEEMAKIRLEHQETFREVKIRLENDVEALQREFEQIKALALINSEKMDYNYQILRKREDENIIIKSQQKRRINKLQDFTNALRKKLREYQQSTSAQILKLTGEIFGLQKCVLEQEAKSISMSKTNDVKYRQVWDLNTKRTTQHINRILTIDQLIYEQLLGLPWKKPTQEVMEKDALRSYRIAKQKSNSASASAKTTTKASPSIKQSIDSSTIQDNDQYKRLLINILDQISAKSGFLVEYRLKYALDPYSYEEHVLVRIDNIFAALGIKEKEDLDNIIDFFLPYTYCAICTKHTSSNRSTQFLLDSSRAASKASLDSSQQSVGSDEGTSGSGGQSESFGNVVGGGVFGMQPDYIIVDLVQNLVYPPTQSTLHLAMEEELEDMNISSLNDNQSYEEDELVKSHSPKRSSTGAFRLTCRQKHPLIINSLFVLKALREFINSHFLEPNHKGIGTQEFFSISRALTSKDVIYFWNHFKLIFSEVKEHLWDGLLEGLKKYHAILLDRQKIYQEVVKFRKQHEELKVLYEKYQTGTVTQAVCAMQRMLPYHESPLHDEVKIHKRYHTIQDVSASPITTDETSKKGGTPVRNKQGTNHTNKEKPKTIPKKTA